MDDRSQFTGRLASATQIIFAALIGVIPSLRFEPGFLPRGVILLGVFAFPGVIGYIGTRSRRPSLLLAAGLTSAVGAFIAFSGVSLIFLVPSVLFFVGAVRLATGTPGSARGRWTGALTQLAIAVALVPLVVAAGASALLVTDSGCWTEYRAAFGVRVEMQPYTTGEIELPSDATSMSCSTGMISARGAGLGALLGAAALGLAVLASRRRRTAAPQVTGMGTQAPSATPSATNSG